MLCTIDEIARDAIVKFSPEDRTWFKAMALEDMQYGHHHLGRWIRNTYGLWHDNPLTEKWRTDESSHVMEGEVDCSADHPDNLSARIIERAYEMLHNVP